MRFICIGIILCLYTVSGSIFKRRMLKKMVSAIYQQDTRKSKVDVDPEVNMNVSQMIRYHGYPCEEHDVETSDGYILSVQRIPHGRSDVHDRRPPVLLQHGLLSSASDWADNLVNESLAYLLADAGFDVWMANSRGNTYSLRHKTLTPDQDKFWDFSWDEMAAYDLPATVDKVLAVTGATQLAYVGHSQGTEIAFARLSRDKDLAKKIRIFVALAPVAYLKHLKSPIRLLAPFSKDLDFLFALFGVRDFFPSSPLIRWLAENVCDIEIPKILCENIMFLFGGYDYNNLNSSRIPVYIAHAPAGTSTRNIIHYAQAVKSGKFCQFDFGEEENMKRYNQTTPPEYDPTKITVPIALFSGTNDWLAVPRDIQKLLPQLQHVIKNQVIDQWEHLDFVWGLNAPSKCYDDVIDVIKTSWNLV